LVHPRNTLEMVEQTWPWRNSMEWIGMVKYILPVMFLFLLLTRMELKFWIRINEVNISSWLLMQSWVFLLIVVGILFLSSISVLGSRPL